MSYRRSETKRKELDALKEKIFDTAMSIMKEEGFDSLTIRDICLHVGISTGMFYKLYSSKVDLLAFYYEKVEQQFDEYVRDQVKDLALDEKIIRFYIWVGQFTANLGVDFCKNFFDSKNQIMNTTKFSNKIINITDNFIDEECAKGLKLSDNRSPQEVSKDLCIMVKGIIFDWSANEGIYDLTQTIGNLLKRCLPGLI